MKEYMRLIHNCAEFIRASVPWEIETAIVLGSGLGELADELEDRICLDYTDIPHFPTPTVEGHSGRLVAGTLEGVPVLAMQGRFHYYEGFSLQEATFPIRVFGYLGITKLILTNAAGGINTSFIPGDLMVITDHINVSMRNPLIGPNLDDFGPRFPDMSQVYSRRMIEKLRDVYRLLDIRFTSGVYSFFTGPCYETPAEIRMMRALGADAIGMSTVPEAIVARHGGMEVCGISCITNMACGILDQPLSHQEVIETSRMVTGKFKAVIRELVRQLASLPDIPRSYSE